MSWWLNSYNYCYKMAPMGRVINLDGSGKERNRLTRSVVLALRELSRQNSIDMNTLDLAAFIALALEGIYSSIDSSVTAWEKRGYWIKADRFRLEWNWSGSLAREMKEAALNNDWGRVAAVAAQIAVRLNKISIPERHRLGKPWVGAWERLSRLNPVAANGNAKNFTP